MITLLINLISPSDIVTILGAIAAFLEGFASIFLVVVKIIMIAKSKDLKTKDKLVELEKVKDEDLK